MKMEKLDQIVEGVWNGHEIGIEIPLAPGYSNKIKPSGYEIFLHNNSPRILARLHFVDSVAAQEFKDLQSESEQVLTVKKNGAQVFIESGVDGYQIKVERFGNLIIATMYSDLYLQANKLG